MAILAIAEIFCFYLVQLVVVIVDRCLRVAGGRGWFCSLNTRKFEKNLSYSVPCTTIIFAETFFFIQYLTTCVFAENNLAAII